MATVDHAEIRGLAPTLLVSVRHLPWLEARGFVAAS
jgi:hypothetical protein